MRRRFLIWLYTKIERLLTQGFRHFRNLAFAAAGSESLTPLNPSSQNSLADFGGDIGIVITTFEPRFEIFAIPLITSLRKTISAPIYLVINGNYDGPADSVAVMKLINEVSQFKDVFPIVFGRMQGCATLWNTGISHSNCSRNFVFNDDISVEEGNIAGQMQIAVDLMESNELITINNSWSHYLISDKCLDEVGLFDERFLGFGEEDGDYILRVVNSTGKRPTNVLLPSFVNIIDLSRDQKVAKGFGKYSLFNKCLYHLKYPDTQSTSKFFHEPGSKFISEDFDIHSIKKFKSEFYPLLTSDNPEEIIDSILNFYA
jgi:hypothetical protein